MFAVKFSVFFMIHVPRARTKKTISLNPDYTQAYNNLGIVLKEQGNVDEAIEL